MIKDVWIDSQEEKAISVLFKTIHLFNTLSQNIFNFSEQIY